MDKKILIDANNLNNVQVAVVENGRLEELEYTSNIKKLIKGNIYLAKVTRVEPSLQAAFIDFGDEKHGFIPFSEIHPDYYNVPSKYRAPEEVLEDEDTVETDSVQSEALDQDEDLDMDKIKRRNAQRYKIQEVLKRNQILLVQAVKEVRGNKGAMFTTYISLAGKYCVIMPKSTTKGGISKRISNIEVRKKLQKIFDEISNKAELSFIIRTAGHGHTKAEIKTDYTCLIKLWNSIREKTLSAIAPAFIYAEDDILKKVVRDMYDKDTSEIVVQGDEAYKNITAIVKLMALTKYVKLVNYNGKTPIFNAYRLDEQLASLYSPVVQLKTGAYIVINPTEALVSIDVNSGKATSERNVEETAVKTNIEAAKEIARQIRLRELSGLIVIDFIDMLESRNKSVVERTFHSLLRKDKAKIQLGHISNFGLLEMSRQCLKPSFQDLNTIKCPQCKGSGVIKSDGTSAAMIFKTIEREIISNHNIKSLTLHLSSHMSMFILNHKREDIKFLEDKYKISIFVLQDLNMELSSFAMETAKREVPQIKREEQQHIPAQVAQAEPIHKVQLNEKKNAQAPRHKAKHSKKVPEQKIEQAEVKDDVPATEPSKTKSTKPSKKGKVKTMLDKLLG